MNSMLVLLEQAADVVVPTRRSALLCVSSTLLASCLGGLELTYFLFLSICWCRLLIYFNLLLLFFLRESSLYFRCVVVFPAACESLIVMRQPRSDVFRDRGSGRVVHLRGEHLDLVSDLFHLIWMLACTRFTVVVTHLYCRWHGWSDVLLWGETVQFADELRMKSAVNPQKSTSWIRCDSPPKAWRGETSLPPCRTTALMSVQVTVLGVGSVVMCNTSQCVHPGYCPSEPHCVFNQEVQILNIKNDHYDRFHPYRPPPTQSWLKPSCLSLQLSSCELDLISVH